MSSPTGKNRHAAIDTPLGTDKLVLKSMSGREELGRLFDYHLVLLDPAQDIDPDKLVGLNVTVRLLQEDGKMRYFNGYIASLSFLGYEEDAGVYHAQMVPWLWFLSRASDCRPFQKETVRQILEKLFADFGFEDYEFQLSGSYSPKPFCVQYNETALNFVSRLMEHEGMYYWWKHENGKHTMVITDDMAKHKEHPDRAKIEWRPRTGVLEDGYLYDLRLQKTVSTGAFATNDYNFMKPQMDLRSKVAKEKKHAAAKFEHFEYPGIFRETKDGSSLSQIRLEEAQAGHESIDAMTTARAMSCGYKFQLTRAERKDQERKYLITSTVLTISVDAYGSGGGGSGDKFESHITCIPDTSVFRPARLSPKPLIRGPQTAVVVGPPGEEIYCDEHGRVKLHFFWDRRSEANENSSKWVRVSHPSAGGSYGFLSIPRVGQEVIVEFLNGDPDQPLVTGRVYNAMNTPPYNLPADKTRSVWKSNSSKGGGGFNEIRLEDAKDAEQVFIHGQKDMDVRVKNIRKEFTGKDQHLLVVNDLTEQVDRDAGLTIGRHHKESIGKDHHVTVGGDDITSVGKSFQVAAGSDVRIEAGGDTEITTAMATAIASGMSVVVEAPMITLKGAGGFIAIGPSGVTIQGTMVLINSGGAAGSKKSVAKKSPEKPKAAEKADDSKAGKVEKAKGMGHASQPGTWKKQTVEDLAAQSGSPFYSK
ncbi:type VI secretion system tip protein TssI/VgrG [Prosthecobacter sp. SYSU 5D2]|uniref:type VI secretion system Vgr family protein n=1 Tax=Prosthecobacter sp. SYSU 5D2 TaxID=3134134 RepID=UPI0031FF45D0